MKTVTITVTLTLVFSAILYIWGGTVASNDYERSVQSYWRLSVKASNLEVKAEYLDKYVEAVEAQGFSGNNAFWLTNPDNGYDENIKALKSLQSRMSEIRHMDVSTFAYQQAISQITQQEQNEARALTSTFEGLWYLKHHLFYWDWVEFWIGAFFLVGILASLTFLAHLLIEESIR